MPKKVSLYDVTESQRDDIKHLGYNYEGKLFQNSMSKEIFKEAKRESILAKIETIMFELIESVKLIKTHVNFTVKKNYRKLN